MAHALKHVLLILKDCSSTHRMMRGEQSFFHPIALLANDYLLFSGSQASTSRILVSQYPHSCSPGSS